MRVFIHDNKIINVDNGQDAARLLADPATTRELSSTEIKDIFNEYAHLAGPDNTVIDGDGNIFFDQDQAALKAQKLNMVAQKSIAKTEMESTLADGVEVNGRTYACQKTDIDSFSMGLTLLDLTQETTIEAYDKNDVPHQLKLEEYRAVCRAVGQTYHAALKTYKMTIKAIVGVQNP